MFKYAPLFLNFRGTALSFATNAPIHSSSFATWKFVNCLEKRVFMSFVFFLKQYIYVYCISTHHSRSIQNVISCLFLKVCTCIPPICAIYHASLTSLPTVQRALLTYCFLFDSTLNKFNFVCSSLCFCFLNTYSNWSNLNHRPLLFPLYKPLRSFHTAALPRALS